MKKKNSRFRNNDISFLVVQCYTFSIQSWCCYLSSRSVIVSPGGWVKRQLCEPLSALFQAIAHLPPTVSRLLLQALFTESLHGELPFPPSLVEGLAFWLLLQPLFIESSHGEHLLVPPPFSSVLRAPSRLCCVSFSVPCLLFRFFLLFFLWGRGQSVQGAMLVYLRGGCGSTTCYLFAHLLVCISQADLELVSGGVGALLVSQCNMVWRSFVRAGGSGCQSFAYSWWFFSCQVWLQCFSKIFDLWISYCLLPPSSCHLGSPSVVWFYFWVFYSVLFVFMLIFVPIPYIFATIAM
jgi:hypothetical protein